MRIKNPQLLSSGFGIRYSEQRKGYTMPSSRVPESFRHLLFLFMACLVFRLFNDQADFDNTGYFHFGHFVFDTHFADAVF